MDWQPDPNTFSVELPGVIVAMETREGRLLVTLLDGRTVDMTDWFAEAPQNPN